MCGEGQQPERRSIATLRSLQLRLCTEQFLTWLLTSSVEELSYLSEAL